MKKIISLIAFMVFVHAGALSVLQAKAAPKPVFARVMLALKGCSSCAHCRTNLRQALKEGSKAQKVSLGNGKVEMVFSQPSTLDIHGIVTSMGTMGMKDLEAVDVLVEMNGRIETKHGIKVFVADSTGQELTLDIAEDTAGLLGHTGVHVWIKAVAQGWERKDKEITLKVRDLKEIKG